MGAPGDIEDGEVRGVKCDAGGGAGRGAQHPENFLGLRDSAGNHVTDGLAARFGQGGPAIGDKAIDVEHGCPPVRLRRLTLPQRRAKNPRNFASVRLPAPPDLPDISAP